MSQVEKLSIALTPEFAAEVRSAVASGDYASTSEVIRDALRAWRQLRRSRVAAIEELQRLWREGIEDGGAAPLDVEALKRQARGRLEARPKTGR